MDYHIHTTTDDHTKDLCNVVGYQIPILNFHTVDYHIMGFRTVDYHTTTNCCIKGYHIVDFQTLVDSCTLDSLLIEFLMVNEPQC